MRYSLSILLLLLSILIINCDTDSISSSFSRPEARLVIIDEESTLEGATIGDSIMIALGLDVKNMSDIFSLGFKISFDEEVFRPKYQDLSFEGESCVEEDSLSEDVSFDGCGIYNNEDIQSSYNFNISGSFFETSGEPVYDQNGNGVLDDGETFSDQNGNGEYDPPIEYPVGTIMLGDENQNDSLDYFEGNLGVPAPHTNGNVWGAGRVCKFYFVGVLTETVFDIEITNAESYIGGDEQFEDYPTSSWDIYSLLVGSPHDPLLVLEQSENSQDGQISIHLKIEDSPGIASFASKITYDPNVLIWLTANQLDFFNPSHYLNYDIDVNWDNDIGEIITEFNHNILTSSVDLELQPLAEGLGDIIKITFQIKDGILDSTSTINIVNNSAYPSIFGYNQNTDSEYELDKGYWTIEESLEINF